NDGTCQATDWDSDPDPTKDYQGNPAHDPAPPGVTQAAAPFKAQPIKFMGNSVQDYKNVLASGRCAAFAVPVYPSLTGNPTARGTGNIPMPVAGEQPSGGHAMCIVGYQDNASIPGGGY